MRIRDLVTIDDQRPDLVPNTNYYYTGTRGPMLDIIDLGETELIPWQYEGVTGIRFKGYAGISGVQW